MAAKASVCSIWAARTIKQRAMKMDRIMMVIVFFGKSVCGKLDGKDCDRKCVGLEK
jgi:hypothetical protein